MRTSVLLKLAATATLAATLSAPAAATVIVYTASLTGPNESPPVASPAVGTAVVTIDDVLDTMRVQATFGGLVGPTTASHIHCCTATPLTGNVGVATATPSFPGFPLGVQSGAMDTTFNMTLASSFNSAFITANGGTPDSAFNSLIAGLNAGRAYFNIHTSFAPGGEIRGFLQVPEPATGALLLLGLSGLAFAARRRRG